MKQYVIGDIHGHYDLLRKTLDWVESQENGEVIFLGDYIDRGPKNKQVVDLLMGGPPDGWKWTFIRGNHEDMAIESKTSRSYYESWLMNGGSSTLREYGADKLPSEVIEFFKSMPRYLFDDHRVFTHAGAVNAYPIDKQPPTITQWYRPEPMSDRGCHGRYVVHGHTPQKVAPFIGRNRANLDRGGVWSNQQVVAVFDSDIAGPPVEVKTIMYHPFRKSEVEDV